MSTAYTTALIAASPECVHKVKARDASGRPAYYFVWVSRAKETAFRQALTQSCIDFTAHGTVIASCFGNAPTDEIRYYLKQQYNFDV